MNFGNGAWKHVRVTIESELCRFVGESTRHTNVLPDCAVPKHFPCFFGQAMDVVAGEQ